MIRFARGTREFFRGVDRHIEGRLVLRDADRADLGAFDFAAMTDHRQETSFVRARRVAEVDAEGDVMLLLAALRFPCGPLGRRVPGRTAGRTA